MDQNRHLSPDAGSLNGNFPPYDARVHGAQPQHPGQGPGQQGPYGTSPHSGPAQYWQPLGGTPQNLDLPLYGASFPDAMKRFWKMMFRFEGRASLSEYWWAYLGVYIATQALSILFVMVFYGVAFAGVMGAQSENAELSGGAAAGMLGVAGVFFLVTLVLGVIHLGITARRLHDAGFSALWMLLYLTGFGGIVILVMTLMPASPNGLKYDPPQVRAHYGR